MVHLTYQISPTIENDQLNALFSDAWDVHKQRDFQAIHNHSLGWVGAYAIGESSRHKRLVGYVNLAWDGGIHAFLLDTTVHPDYQRRGIGMRLVTHAISLAKERGMDWLHVDYEPDLEQFYKQCGLRPSSASVMNLQSL
jgi:GNAT superfamily N-acetyltransferase